MRDTFRKTGPESAFDMFEAEADGLNELRAAGEVRVPEVIDVGVMNGQAYIDIEKLELEPTSPDIEQRFGTQLAALHRHTQDHYGWFRDNTIGLTPQHNDLSDDWIGFFRKHRLGYQLELAARNGYGAEVTEPGQRLAQALPSLFEGYTPEASLLHGDLWGGNIGFTGGGAGHGMVYLAGKQSHKLSNDEMVEHIVEQVVRDVGRPGVEVLGLLPVAGRAALGAIAAGDRGGGEEGERRDERGHGVTRDAIAQLTAAPVAMSAMMMTTIMISTSVMPSWTWARRLSPGLLIACICLSLSDLRGRS